MYEQKIIKNQTGKKIKVKMNNFVFSIQNLIENVNILSGIFFYLFICLINEHLNCIILLY